MTLRVVIVKSLSSIPQHTTEAMWLVKLIDSIAGHCHLGSFHVIPTFEAILYQTLMNMQINHWIYSLKKCQVNFDSQALE